MATPLRAQCPDGTPPPCGHQAPAPPNSVAVLYFDNLTRDSAVAYLADGLTEELIVRLGRVSRLDVRTRSDSRRVRTERDARPSVLGRAVNASYLLTGSLQALGGRTRATVELVRAATGQRVWGDVFDRVGSDPLSAQEQIAVAVATAVVGQLEPEERAGLARAGTRDAGAYDLFLRARYFHNRGRPLDRYRAIALYEQALARDSGFALAAAQLGYAWTDLGDLEVPQSVREARARAAASRALQLDSTLAEGYSAMAWPMLNVDHDAVRALQMIRRAVQLDPRSPDAHFDLGVMLFLFGRRDEALAELGRARELDSLAPFYTRGSVYFLANAGRTREADSLLAALHRLLPSDPSYTEVQAWVRLAQHRCDEAVAGFRSAIAAGVPGERGLVASLACRGDTATVRSWVDSAVATGVGRSDPLSVAAAYTVIGESDSALTWLEDGESRGELVLVYLTHMPFGALRGNPRFEALLRSFGVTGVREGGP